MAPANMEKDMVTVEDEFVNKETAQTPESSDEIDAAAVGGNLEDLPKHYFLQWKFLGTLVAVVTMLWSQYIGYVFSANSITIINADLGPDPNYVLIPIVKTLCGGVGMLLVGRLSDIFGRRYFMLAAQLMAMVGCVVCATASTINTLIGGTVLIGLAGAIQTLCPMIMMELVANKHRGYMVAFLYLCGAPVSSLGPIMSRTLIARTALGWRWIYYIPLVVNTICGIMLFLCYHPPTHKMLHKNRSIRQDLKQLDWIGMFLYTAGLVILVLGLSWGGGFYPWKSAAVISCIILGVLTLVAFVLYESYVTVRYPLVPVAILKNGRFIAVVGVASVGTMFYYSMTVIWPQMITALYETDPTMIGLMSGVIGGFSSLGQVFGGSASRLGYGHWQMRVATLSMVGFIGAMASNDASTRSTAIALTALGNLTLGFMECIAVIVAPFTIAPEHIGLATGFLGAARSSLGAVAIAIFSSILTTEKAAKVPATMEAVTAQDNISSSTLAALIQAGKAGTMSSIATIPGIPAGRQGAYVKAIQDANIGPFRLVFYCSLIFGAFSIVCVFFVKNFDHHFDNTVSRKLQGMKKTNETKNAKEKELDV